MRLVAARTFSTRIFSGWRPLLWFWLSVLVVVIAGGTVLRYLGPPEQPVREQGRSEPQRTPVPVVPAPPRASASASAVTPQPRQPDPVAPSPPRPQPAPDAQAPSTAEQASVQPSSQPRIILHPADSSSGTTVIAQLASQLGLASDQIAVGTSAEAVPRAVIRFYAPEDHPLARRLGTELAALGYSWRIENLAERPSTAGHQPLEIWLPKR